MSPFYQKTNILWQKATPKLSFTSVEITFLSSDLLHSFADESAKVTVRFLEASEH